MDLTASIVLNVLLWSALYPAYAGVGLLFRRCAGAGVVLPARGDTGFWEGYALWLGVLQVWHLFAPVGPWCLPALFAVGGAGLLAHRRELGRLALHPRAVRGILLWVAAAIAVGFLAMQPVRNYDTGLYHMTSVKWNRAGPVVPGLGNLHGRLAFNSAYLLYGAMLDGGPWREGAQHAAAGLLLLAALAEAAGAAAVLCARGRVRCADVYRVVMLAPVLTQLLGPDPSSLAPDLPVFLFGLILTGRVVEALTEGERGKRRRGAAVAAAVLLAAAGITVKVSFMVFGALCVMVIVWAGAREGRGTGRAATVRFLASAALAVAAFGAPWCWRNVVLSGYPFFPATVWGVDVPWRVPLSLAQSTRNWILSWAREPGAHWCLVLGSWEWMGSWIRRLDAAVWIPIGLGTAGCIAAAWRKAGWAWAGMLPAFGSLVYWFFSAPDPRFAGAAFWIPACVGMAAAVCRGPDPARGVGAVLAFMAVAALAAVRHPVYGRPPSVAPPRLPAVYFRTQKTDSGLAVHVPLRDDRCWNLPLPCTPYFRANLHAFDPGQVIRGFYLDDTLTYADVHGGTPGGVDTPAALGVVLVGDGWGRFDGARGVRRMRSPGRMLVYSAQAGRVSLRLTPKAVLVAGRRVVSGRAVLSCDGQRVAGFRPAAGRPLAAAVEVKAGFHLLELAVGPSNRGATERSGSGAVLDIGRIALDFSPRSDGC